MVQSVAVVTGSSRGLGRGIARALGTGGFKVYLTGRNQEELESAAAEINAAGGVGVGVVCDHRDDEAVKALFERVDKESGRLDILVNNAAAVYPADLSAPGPFWEKPLHLVDMIDVGLRSNYVAAYAAAPLMIATGGGLIAHISFYGAVSYFHGPAYGAAKAGTDKMAFDMAADLRPHNVASVSIWPGFILSDMLKSLPKEHLPPALVERLPTFEAPEFTGKVIERLWQDPQRMQFTGETLIAAEEGERYDIKDLDGKQPLSYASSMGSPKNRFHIPQDES
ncbi:SDR family NAD(P)-dependent oxidoreductase [Pseudomaricurvus sp.]|uniref:SDR family NAD(P)-dependent oxidoreductase n=1 Tax=Pseudomaricurvus sp. TaxID=2004510 RepID=UPI003F6BBD9A